MSQLVSFYLVDLRGLFNLKNWKIKLEKYLLRDLYFRSKKKRSPLLAATSIFLHNSQPSGGPAWRHVLQNQSKESQIQLRQLKFSLNTFFPHVRSVCLVVQWNLFKVMVSAGSSKTHSLIWNATEKSPLFCSTPLSLSLPIFMLLLHLKSARSIRKMKNRNQITSSQSWETREKRESCKKKNICKVFGYILLCMLITLFNTLSIIFIFWFTSGITNEKEKKKW